MKVLILCLLLAAQGVWGHPKQLTLTKSERGSIATVKATCPFIGSIVANGALPVRQSKASPLARVEDIVKLGNTGGGDLGNLLFVFATGNHAYEKAKPSASKLSKLTPLGFLSLDFPGSQGSHAGHSGILQGNPRVLNSGRFSRAAFSRLKKWATKKGKQRYYTRSSIGKFIAANLMRDKKSRVLAASSVLRAAGRFVEDLGPALVSKARSRSNAITASERTSLIALTKSLGANNLVGSSGEFGLLLAFLTNSPNSVRINGEFAVSASELEGMFQHKLPKGWRKWEKRITDWLLHTSSLTTSAAREFRALKNSKNDKDGSFLGKLKGILRLNR